MAIYDEPVATSAADAMDMKKSMSRILAEVWTVGDWILLDTATRTPVANCPSIKVMSWLKRFSIVPVSVVEKKD